NFSFELFVRTSKKPIKLIFNNQKPVFFVDQKASLLEKHADYKLLNLTNFEGRPVAAVYAQNLNELESLKQTAQTLGVRSYEQDVSPIERFLMERFIQRELEIEVSDETQDVFINPVIRKASNVKIPFIYMSLDIETGVKGELYSVALDYGDTFREKREGTVLMVG